MPDDAIERAKKIGIQVAAECPDGTAPSIVMAAASGAQLGAMLAFASQQAPEGWRLVPVEPSLPMILAGQKVGGLGVHSRFLKKLYRAMLDAAPSDSDGSPAEACVRCGGSNPSWSAPSPLWDAVMRGGSINGDALYHDMVCVKCFMQIAEEKGIAHGWRLIATDVSAELETVTPSGRVWDEQDWLWKDPGSVERPEGIAQPPTKEPTP